MLEYLGEIETELENTLACLSEAPMGSNHEKNGGRQSRDTQIFFSFFFSKKGGGRYQCAKAARGRNVLTQSSILQNL